MTELLEKDLSEQQILADLSEKIRLGMPTVGSHEDLLGGSVADGVYFTTDIHESGREVALVGLDAAPTLAIGAGTEDSHHEVSFAKVKLAEDEKEVGSGIYVAVKRYDAAPEVAAGEVDGLLAVQQKGFDSLEPLAVIKDGDNSYVLTVFKGSIGTLDNNDWSPRSGPVFERIKSDLRFVGTTMGAWHARGFFHGDSQIKNFARSDAGKSVVIDLESATRFAQNDEDHIMMMSEPDNPGRNFALADLRLLWLSLNRKIGPDPTNIFLGEDATAEEIYAVFNDNFLSAYTQTLLEELPAGVRNEVPFEAMLKAFDEHVRGHLGLPSVHS